MKVVPVFVKCTFFFLFLLRSAICFFAQVNVFFPVSPKYSLLIFWFLHAFHIPLHPTPSVLHLTPFPSHTTNWVPHSPFFWTGWISGKFFPSSAPLFIYLKVHRILVFPFLNSLCLVLYDILPLNVSCILSFCVISGLEYDILYILSCNLCIYMRA